MHHHSLEAGTALGTVTFLFGAISQQPGLTGTLAQLGTFMGGSAAIIGVCFTIYRDRRDRKGNHP